MVLADVADPDLAERGVEGEAPRVAQADQLDPPVDLVDVGGEQLAELVAGILGAALGVEGAAAVAHADVQAPVGAEGQVAAVVVGLGLGHVQQLAGAAAVAELCHARISPPVGPVQVEPPVGVEVGMEGEAEQALLGADRDLAGEIDHRAAPPALHANDTAGLLEHPQCARVARGDPDPGRPVEPGGDALDVERVRAAALGGGLRPIDAGQRIAQRADRHGRRRNRHHDSGDHDHPGAH